MVDVLSMPHLTPLCPVGHLPHKGGDRWGGFAGPIGIEVSASFGEARIPRSISPLVGEMSAELTEGGKPPQIQTMPHLFPDGHLLPVGEKGKEAP